MIKIFNLFSKKQAKNIILQTRNLNLLEYQSKTLLDNNGVNIQKFFIAENAKEVIEKTKSLNFEEYVIKAQILAGGRGLGTFDNGFKGGVHLTKDPKQIQPIVEKMVGHKLITKQTSKDGIQVKKVMVAESVNIIKETYLCIIMDREHNGPVIIASPSGGTDIENVAKKTPHLIKTIPVNIEEGVTDSIAQECSDFLGFKGASKSKAAIEIKKLWEMFKKLDVLQLEINPLVETDRSEVISVDAKLQFDDNAKFRQKEIFALEDSSEIDEREVDAAKYNLNYIGLKGNIGCLVNGAGLAMATMDIINLHGGQPANFLDLGGGIKEEHVFHAFRIICSDPNVKVILVNVFGGIVNCATIAAGIINTNKKMKFKVPLVVRLQGTNVETAQKLLRESGLPLQTAHDLEEAAMKAVNALK